MLTTALLIACSSPSDDGTNSTTTPSSIDTSIRSDTGTAPSTDTGSPPSTTSSPSTVTGDTGALSLVGRTYIFDPDAMQFVGPPGLAVPPQFFTSGALLHVVA